MYLIYLAWNFEVTRLNLLMSALVNSWLVGMRIGPSSPIQPSSRDLD